jgi:RND superfamily putative drug exporter
MTLVPAVLALLGHRSWWLERAVPHVDLEGDALGRRPREELIHRRETAPSALTR